MAEVKTVTIVIDVKTGKVVSAKKDFDSLNKTVTKASKEMTGSLGKMTNSLVKLGAGFLAFSAIKKVIGGAIKTIADFEKAISSLSAITGATGKDLDILKGKVLDVAKNTKKSAVEVAKAFELIGSKAPKLLENADALAAVTEQAIILSKASGEDLSQSAEALTGVMNQFNLEASESERIINALAAGSQKGAAPVAEIAAAIDKFGTVAAAANISVEQSIGLVETLAEKNIKGAEAGTQLRNIILKLQVANLGFTNGVFNLNDALEEVKDKNLDAKEATKLFGLESITAGNILIDGIDTLNKYTDAITGTNTAFDQAVIQTDNLVTKTEELSASYDNLVISINEGNGSLSEVAKTIVGLGQTIIDFAFNLNEAESASDSFFDNLRIAAMRSAGGFAALGAGRLELTELENAFKDARRNIAFDANLIRKRIEEIGVPTNIGGARALGALQQELKTAEANIRFAERAFIESGQSLDKLGGSYFKVKEEVAALNEELTETANNTTELTEKELKAAQKAAEARAKLARESAQLIQDINNTFLIDGVEKELEIERTKWDRKIQIAREKFGEQSEVLKSLEAARESALGTITDEAETSRAERAADIQSQRDDVERARIKDNFDRLRADKLAAFENDIADLDDFKENENALIIEKKLLLQEQLNEIDLLEEENKKAKKEEEDAADQLAQDLKIQNQLDIAEGAANLAGALSGLAKKGSAEAKALASIQVIISGAVAIIQALAQLGPIAGAIAAAGIVAVTAAQLQKINSAKALKHGEVMIDGAGTETSDSIPAMLSKHETVTTAKQTKKHLPVLKAIHDDRFDDYLNRIMVQRLYAQPPRQIAKKGVDKGVNIQIPEGYRMLNPSSISTPIIEAMREHAFLNQGQGWE